MLDVLGSALEGGLAGAEMQQQPAEILELVEPPTGGGRFGFTWAVHAFSSRAGAVCSPWVTVAGREWRLTAYPQGLNVGAGTHLAGGCARGGMGAGRDECGGWVWGLGQGLWWGAWRACLPAGGPGAPLWGAVPCCSMACRCDSPR